MPLSAGTRLGPYEIVSPLGAGGMGEVYRARDTRLDRTVAIKVLPTHLSANPDLRARFEREAKAISALQHSNICVLHDVGKEADVDFLVMEYLEGETLAARLARKPLPLDEALRIAIEVADALDMAHRHGVIHRDLKPGNIMLTKSGAKLMDFGLAKPHGFATSGSIPAFSAVATMTSPVSPITTAGTVVGTVQYMSPEQIQGHEADARSDLFAFGATLYEMLSGKRAFQGKSQLSVASAILEKDPEPLNTLQPLTPLSLERVVRKCLAKDLEDRWQNTRDLATELRWIAEGGTAAASEASGKWRRRELLYGTAALFLLLATIFSAFSYWRLARTPARAIIAEIAAPDNTRFVFSGATGGLPVISSDGHALAFCATDENGKAMLWVRSLDSLAAHHCRDQRGRVIRSGRRTAGRSGSLPTAS
jgi:serine/threonine protein kinase